MIAFSINEDRGYVIITVKDSPTLEEYVESCRALKAHNQFHPTTHRICDFTGVGDLSVSTRELLAFVEEAKGLPKNKSAKTALIGGSIEDRGMMEMFASHFDRGSFKVFETGRDALAWVLWADLREKKASNEAIRIHRLSGEVEAKGVVQLQNAWFQEEGFDRNAPVLWDLREAKFGSSLGQIEASAADIQMRSLVNRPNGKTVILVSSKLHEVTLKSAFREGLERADARIYRNEDDALAWLSEV